MTAEEVVIELAATFEELSTAVVVNVKFPDTCTDPPSVYGANPIVVGRTGVQVRQRLRMIGDES
jgi:hypothetical protein